MTASIRPSIGMSLGPQPCDSTQRIPTRQIPAHDAIARVNHWAHDVGFHPPPSSSIGCPLQSTAVHYMQACELAGPKPPSWVSSESLASLFRGGKELPAMHRPTLAAASYLAHIRFLFSLYAPISRSSCPRGSCPRQQTQLQPTSPIQPTNLPPISNTLLSLPSPS